MSHLVDLIQSVAILYVAVVVYENGKAQQVQWNILKGMILRVSGNRGSKGPAFHQSNDL